MDQITWWDETHQTATIGGLGTDSTRKPQILFMRDEEGKLDLTNGTVKAIVDRVKTLNVKYEMEVLFCLGCYILKKGDGDNNDISSYNGRRCESFDYNGKVVLSLKDYKEKENLENKRVKGLATGRKGI
jgi:hypothetical protein